MSIAMESRGMVGRIAIFDSTEEMEERNQGEAIGALSASSSSSIGENSDEEENGGEGEVRSAFKGPILGMESLEESLPIRRSISNFYNGKSKSFASLSDVAVSCDSARDFGKEDNVFSRKRRNLLALKTLLERPLKSSGGGITKKPTAPTRSTLAIAAAVSGSSRHINGSENANDQQQNFLPPLPRPGKSTAINASAVNFSSPQQFSFPLRSFSSGDLSEMARLGSTNVEPYNLQKIFE